jgi:multicomponent Na+:H+ antiporter subunit A
MPETIHHPHEGGLTIWLGPLVLGVAGLAGGLFYATYHALFSGPMASAAVGAPVTIEIGWVPHLNLAFALSMATIALGVAIYLLSTRLRSGIAGFLAFVGWGPDKGFDQAMRGLIRGASTITRILQPGRLDQYMAVTVGVIIAALFGPLIYTGGWPVMPAFPRLHFYEWAVFALLLVGILPVVLAKNRLTAILALGIQGFAVALLFMLLGAPDLSFTQFMVETLSVVILTLAMTRLKLSVADHRPLRDKLQAGLLALGAGAGFGLFLLAIAQRPFDRTLSDFFEQYSYAIAHGRNIVNVILVDFRGVDTMGEIAVVMVTGLAVLALIRIRVERRGTRYPDPLEKTP